jgi:pSer/pThr/pTyr-binding forkhead associated (FHA) protein
MGDDKTDWDDTTDTRKSTVELLAQIPEKPSVLELVQGPGAPHKYVLVGEEIVVGRGEEVEIQLFSAELSRRHLLITKKDDEFSCEDLESRNGVLLNGIKIHSASLKDGDNIQLGDMLFIFHQGS